MRLTGRLYLVTGGTGFLGSALVRALVARGDRVRTLDDDSRGSRHRLIDMAGSVEIVPGDVRDAETVRRAVRGVDVVCHLAAINGTEFFYTKPELVLEVAVKGIVNVIDACLADKVRELALVSSSEVYQHAPVVPTDERVPLSVPDPLNPRYSYGGGKLISELLAINYGRRHFRRVTIVRPHNVYGPDMGFEHVIPQLATRMWATVQHSTGPLSVPIQGTGHETRAFVYIDDMVDGFLRVLDRGEHLGIYHVGTTEEITIAALAKKIGRYYGREVEVIPGVVAVGATPRRCPNISKMRGLGFEPRVSLDDGLSRTLHWYDEHADTVMKERSSQP